MARRLLRTIAVTITVTEIWTLVWPAPEVGATPVAEQCSRAQRHSTCTTIAVGAGAGTAPPALHGKAENQAEE